LTKGEEIMTTFKTILLALTGILIISGCATTQVAEETPVAQQPADVASSTAQENLDEKPAEEMQPIDAPAVEVTFDQVYFAYDQSKLSEQARAALSNNAVILQTSPDLRVTIEGHCDDRGSDEYNLALGERRARAVRNFLVSLGIAPERMETISYGEEMPVNPNQNETAWAMNRRAEFKKLN
jgi:peptidoglycan-associated lipoprotein